MVETAAIARIKTAWNHGLAVADLLANERDVTLLGVLRMWHEASARALWLLDPRNSPERYVSRAITEMREDLREMAKLDPNFSQTVTAAVVESRAEDMGLKTVRDGSGRLRIGESRPNNLAVIEATNPERRDELQLQYRMGSAVVHGNYIAWHYGMAPTGDSAGPVAVLEAALRTHVQVIDAWSRWSTWHPESAFRIARRNAVRKWVDAVGRVPHRPSPT